MPWMFKTVPQSNRLLQTSIHVVLSCWFAITPPLLSCWNDAGSLGTKRDQTDDVMVATIYDGYLADKDKVGCKPFVLLRLSLPQKISACQCVSHPDGSSGDKTAFTANY